MNPLKLKVSNMIGRSGRPVANQFRIVTDIGTYFQSYETVIAFIPFGNGKVLLDTNSWDYSVTTGRYRNQFLGESIAETRKNIADGIYELVDLN